VVGLHFLVRFRSPPRAGAGTNSWVPSDTLAAALGWAAGELGDYGVYADLLLSGGLLVTSVFPRLGGFLFWPRLDRGEFRFACRGARSDWAEHRRRCAPVNRLTGEADVFWWEAGLWKAGGIPVLQAHFVAAVRSEAAERLKAWIRVLADAGLGGGRSAGAGGFEVEEVRPGPVPADGGVLWSVAVPDGAAGFDPARVPWVRREGYHDGSVFGRANPRKVGIWAVPEGVRVGSGFKGKVVSLDGDRVLYCGAAFAGRLS